MNSRKNILVFLLFSILFYQNLFPQNRLPNRNPNFISDDNFFAQIYTVPNSKFDSLNIIFFYSVCYSNLIFQKDTNNENKYFAIPIFEANFKDYDGITRKRIITKDTIFVDNFEITSSKNHYFSNFEKLNLGMNDYKVAIKLENGKISKSATTEILLENYSSLAKKNIILSPFFLQSTTVKNNYQPLIANNYIPFSVPKFTMFFPISYSENSLYNYKIEKKISENNENNNENDWGNFITVTGNCELIENAAINLEKEFDVINFTVRELAENKSNNSKQFGLLKCEISMMNFSPAIYTVNIKNEKSNESFDFEIRWNDAPISLQNSDFAIEQMYLVLTDDEYEKIKDGDKYEKFSNILKYWKQKDPTPETEYNEAMTEYFRRVDYALLNFQTITQKDGAKSDMGKIYILNGKPDTVSNEINNKISCEVWNYDKIKKKYIFELVSVGIYQLVKIEDLI